MGLGKNSIDNWPLTVKIIFFLLQITVLLSCMVLTEKKYIFSSVYGITAWDLENIQSTLYLHRKTNIFVSDFLEWVLEKSIILDRHRKKSILLEPHRKKKKIYFWLQYYCRAQDFEKFQSTPDPTEKKIVWTYSTSRAQNIFIGNLFSQNFFS